MSDSYKGHKPGSRKAIIHKAFDDGGEDAAVVKADELGIAPGTVRSWMGAWRKGEVGKEPASREAKPAKPGKPSSISADGKKLNLVRKGKLIHMKYAPEVKGVLLQEGPEQSEVKWDNGNRTFCSNDWFELEEENAQ